jgi:hypothetical protein
MRTFGLIVLAGSVFGISSLHAAPVCTAGAGIWNEGDDGTGDAGKLPATANVTVGSGSLNEICGSMSNTTTGGDMYELIINGSTFSAVTAAAPTNGLNDPALYLFDSTGAGLDADNDISVSNLQAGFTLTGLTPGIYYLAIMPNNQQPEHGNNEIFGNITGTTGTKTPQPGNAHVDGWTNAGTGTTGAAYTITLTDAVFATTPEPATMGLMGLGLGLLAFAKRRA